MKFFKRLSSFIVSIIKSNHTMVIGIASIITFVGASFLDDDWYKAIFLGVFIVCFYEMRKRIFEYVQMDEISAIAALAIGLLGVTSLITILIYYLIIDINPCDKNRIFYSEKLCRIEEAKEIISEDYPVEMDDGYIESYK